MILIIQGRSIPDLYDLYYLYDLYNLHHLGQVPWVLDTYYTDPAQHLTAAGQDVDDLDRDLSDLSDLGRSLSDLSDLDRDLSDLSDLGRDLSDLSVPRVETFDTIFTTNARARTAQKQQAARDVSKWRKKKVSPGLLFAFDICNNSNETRGFSEEEELASPNNRYTSNSCRSFSQYSSTSSTYWTRDQGPARRKPLNAM